MHQRRMMDAKTRAIWGKHCLNYRRVIHARARGGMPHVNAKIIAIWVIEHQPYF